MAKFCKYCGSPLEEGQVCTCPQSQAAAGAPQQEPVQPNPGFQAGPNGFQGGPNGFQAGPNNFQGGPNNFQGAPQQPKQPSAVGTAFQNIVPFFKSYLDNPVAATQAMLGQRDMPMAIILLVIQAVVGGLALFGILSKICSTILDTMSMGVDVSEMIGVSIGPAILPTLLWGVVASALCIALEIVGVFAVAKIMKSQATFVDAMIACAANSGFVTVVLLLGFILGFLNLMLGAILIGVSMICWFIMGVISLRAITPDADRGMAWIGYVVATVLVYFIGAWIWSLVLPGVIGEITISNPSSGMISMSLNDILARQGMTIQQLFDMITNIPMMLENML